MNVRVGVHVHMCVDTVMIMWTLKFIVYWFEKQNLNIHIKPFSSF